MPSFAAGRIHLSTGKSTSVTVRGGSKLGGKKQAGIAVAVQCARQGKVLVAGASSGIGLEIAKCFVDRGFDPILIARRREASEELAHDLQQWRASM
jgi:hypothetical protein